MKLQRGDLVTKKMFDVTVSAGTETIVIEQVRVGKVGEEGRYDSIELSAEQVDLLCLWLQEAKKSVGEHLQVEA